MAASDRLSLPREQTRTTTSIHDHRASRDISCLRSVGCSRSTICRDASEGVRRVVARLGRLPRRASQEAGLDADARSEAPELEPVACRQDGSRRPLGVGRSSRPDAARAWSLAEGRRTRHRVPHSVTSYAPGPGTALVSPGLSSSPQCEHVVTARVRCPQRSWTIRSGALSRPKTQRSPHSRSAWITGSRSRPLRVRMYSSRGGRSW